MATTTCGFITFLYRTRMRPGLLYPICWIRTLRAKISTTSCGVLGRAAFAASWYFFSSRRDIQLDVEEVSQDVIFQHTAPHGPVQTMSLQGMLLSLHDMGLPVTGLLVVVRASLSPRCLRLQKLPRPRLIPLPLPVSDSPKHRMMISVTMRMSRNFKTVSTILLLFSICNY